MRGREISTVEKPLCFSLFSTTRSRLKTSNPFLSLSHLSVTRSMRPVISLARAGPAPPSAVGDGGGGSGGKSSSGSGMKKDSSNYKSLPRLHRLPSPSSSPSRPSSNRSRAAGLTASPEPSKEASSSSASAQLPAAPASTASAAASASKSAAAFAYAQGLFSKFRGNESVSREKKKKERAPWGPDRGSSRLLFALIVAQPRRMHRVCLERAGERAEERASDEPCAWRVCLCFFAKKNGGDTAAERRRNDASSFRVFFSLFSSLDKGEWNASRPSFL